MIEKAAGNPLLFSFYLRNSMKFLIRIQNIKSEKVGYYFFFEKCKFFYSEYLFQINHFVSLQSLFRGLEKSSLK
jgi:hypothetical protein